MHICFYATHATTHTVDGTNPASTSWYLLNIPLFTGHSKTSKTVVNAGFLNHPQYHTPTTLHTLMPASSEKCSRWNSKQAASTSSASSQPSMSWCHSDGSTLFGRVFFLGFWYAKRNEIIFLKDNGCTRWLFYLQFKIYSSCSKV